jgi:hypothetical protein
MNPIFRSCEKWYAGICPNECVRNSFYRSVGEIDSLPGIHPLDLDKLNRICAACDIPLEIQKKECPVCGGHISQNADIPIMELDSLKIYNYQCNACSRELFSYILV